MDPIYCIRAASGSEGRYIGVTCLLPEERLQDHLSEARRGGKNHRLNWLRGLPEPPIIEVIEWVLPGDRVEREKYWIALFRDYGHNLVNGTDGGDGVLGYRHTPEANAKNRAAHIGRTHSPETIAKITEKTRGLRRSPETLSRMSVANTGKKLTPEHCAKISAVQTGKKKPTRSPAHCAANAAARTGKKRSPESIENMRRARWGAKDATV